MTGSDRELQPRSDQPLWGLLAIAVSVAAVAVRCFPWREVFGDSGPIPFSVDNSSHLWRAETLASSFPGLHSYDRFFSFPAGGEIPWPPGFDLLLAFPALLGLGQESIAPWGVFLMPLLGGAAVYLLYRLGRAVFDPPTGLIAALLLAFMGGSVNYSFLGRVDHHGLVAPVTLAVFLSFLGCARASSRRGRLGWGLACGLLGAVAASSWIVTPPIYFLPIPGTLLLLRIRPSRGQGELSTVSLGLTLAFVFLSILLFADLGTRPFDLYRPSLFLLLPYVLSSLAVAVTFAGRRLLPVALLIAAAAGLFLITRPEALSPLREAIDIAAGRDTSYLMSEESRPLFFQSATFSLNRAVASYSYLFLLTPLFFAALLWETVRTKAFSAERIFFGVYFVLAAALLVAQTRFGEFAAPAVALLIAWAVRRGGALLRRAGEDRSGTILPAALKVCAVLALVASVSPLAASLRARPKLGLFAYPGRVYEMGRALALLEPFPARERDRPSYGLLASWSDSTHLLHSSRTPVMVSSFGTEDARKMNVEAFRILLATDEEEAYRSLVENRIRFVVVSPVFEELDSMSSMAGVPYETLIDAEYSRLGLFRPRQAFIDTVHSRLYLGDGTNRGIGEYPTIPLAHFQLQFESPAGATFFGDRRPLLLAYRVVPGAHLEGRGTPGERVRLSLDLRTNTGRIIAYSRHTQAGADGSFNFIVPYPTEGTASDRTTTQGPYRIETEGGTFTAQVSEEAVLAGSRANIEATP